MLAGASSSCCGVGISGSIGLQLTIGTLKSKTNASAPVNMSRQFGRQRFQRWRRSQANSWVRNLIDQDVMIAISKERRDTQEDSVLGEEDLSAGS